VRNKSPMLFPVLGEDLGGTYDRHRLERSALRGPSFCPKVPGDEWDHPRNAAFADRSVIGQRKQWLGADPRGMPSEKMPPDALT